MKYRYLGIGYLLTVTSTDTSVRVQLVAEIFSFAESTVRTSTGRIHYRRASRSIAVRGLIRGVLTKSVKLIRVPGRSDLRGWSRSVYNIRQALSYEMAWDSWLYDWEKKRKSFSRLRPSHGVTGFVRQTGYTAALYHA